MYYRQNLFHKSCRSAVFQEALKSMQGLRLQPPPLILQSKKQHIHLRILSEEVKTVFSQLSLPLKSQPNPWTDISVLLPGYLHSTDKLLSLSSHQNSLPCKTQLILQDPGVLLKWPWQCQRGGAFPKFWFTSSLTSSHPLSVIAVHVPITNWTR